MKNYKKMYIEALERARYYHSKDYMLINSVIENIFPELIEKEYEKRRKEIIDFLELPHPQFVGNRNHEKWIAWLEKQGNTSETFAKWSEEDEQMILSIEQVMNCASLLNIVPEKIDNIKSWLKSLRPKKQQKPIEKQDEQQGKSALEVWKDMRLEVYQQASGNRHEPNYSDDTTKMFSLNDIDEIIEKISEHPTADKIEPKFNVGNWVILPLGIIAHIDSLNSTDYQVTTTDGKICDFKIAKQDNYRLWSINDTKDGDVLVASDESIFIYAGSTDRYAKFYVGLTKHGTLNFDGGDWDDKIAVHPATKEQRDLLFEKMENAGYMWDSEKKELKKIEQKALNADKVIEWLDEHVPTKFEDMQNYVNQFKIDFNL